MKKPGFTNLFSRPVSTSSDYVQRALILIEMNPPAPRPRLLAARLVAAALAISCLGLVDSAYPQPGLTQPSVALDAAVESEEMLPPLVDLGTGLTN